LWKVATNKITYVQAMQKKCTVDYPELSPNFGLYPPS
jgi:hypothetical protein